MTPRIRPGCPARPSLSPPLSSSPPAAGSEPQPPRRAGACAPAAAPPAAKQAEDAEPPLPPSEIESRLPEGVREAVLSRSTGGPRRDDQAAGRPGGRHVQPDVLLRGQGRAARMAYDYGGWSRTAERAPQDRQHEGVSCSSSRWPRDMLLPAASSTARSTSWPPGDGAARAPEARGLHERDPDEREGDLVTGPGQPPVASVDALSGREVIVGSSAPTTRAWVRVEREARGCGEAARRDQGRAREPRGRRPPRDGERGPDPGHRRGRLHRGVLEEGLPEPDRPRAGGGAHAAYLAIAIRKNSPQLAAALNTFMGNYGLGTAFGDQVERKYLVSHDGT